MLDDDVDGEKERGDITKALTRWWRSQNIEPEDAAFIMATMIGSMIGLLAVDAAHTRRLLKILQQEIDRAGRSAVKFKSVKKGEGFKRRWKGQI